MQKSDDLFNKLNWVMMLSKKLNSHNEVAHMQILKYHYCIILKRLHEDKDYIAVEYYNIQSLLGKDV